MNVDFTTLINFFEANPYLNLVSLFIAVFGIILSIYFYKRSLKIKKPTFLVRTINLVKQNVNKIDSVEILYKGDKIQNLSISKIALWNDGKDTINSNDIAQNSPLLIYIDDEYQILDAEIIFQKNPSNDFKVKLLPDQNSVLISFDYFDYLDGTIINVYHTGESSRNILLSGKIKSVRNFTRKTNNITILPKFLSNFLDRNLRNSHLFFKKIMGWSVITVSIMSIFLSLQNLITPDQIEQKKLGIPEIWAFGFIGLMYLYIGMQILKR